MACFHVIGQAGAEIQGRKALAGRGDVVFLALDCLDGDLGDRSEIDLMSSDDKFVLRNLALLEDTVDGGEVEFGGHVHDSQIFVVEAVVRIMVRRIAAHHILDLL